MMLVGALTCYALLHSLYDLKAAQMNVQLMHYVFKLGLNAREANKNICCMKSEGAIGHIKVTRWFKKFCSGWKNFNDQAVLQAVQTNLESIKQA